MIYPQFLLDLHGELIVDLFAGGGGASCGIEMATGRQVDVAINHDPAAVSMHEVNHPQTRHFTADVFEVDPVVVAGGRPIGLLWASPDCKHFSKAKGGKPVSKKIRSLAWVVVKWAKLVRPRVICLENVEEFRTWGPLATNGRPCPERKGQTFRRWVRALEREGYQVEWRELRACNYGAPTIRKRLFVVARRDGKPIVWPERTHGPGTRRKYLSAADCIDWSIPMLSIFASPDEAKAWARYWRAQGLDVGTPRRPLAEKTLARVARGVVKFVLENPRPFVLNLAQRAPREYGVEEVLRTQHAGGNAFALAAPYLIPRYGERDGQEPRVRDIQRPHPVVVPTGNGAQLVSAFLAKHYGGVVGTPLDGPMGSITAIDHHSIVAATLAKLRGTSHDAPVDEPLHTISAGGTHHGIIAAFLQSYYGNEVRGDLREPIRTIPSVDRFGLVTVRIQGEPYFLADIVMRMLAPRELYRAQSFPDSYVIDHGVEGRRFTKTEQVRMVGNSVPPREAAAIVRANCPELVARDEAREAVA
jgi:DNA (cytosine-5)-methyltransferase 1